MFALTPRLEMAKATTAQVNADLIRRAYDAFSRGDMEGAFAVFAKDILWHIPGRGPLSRDYRGHAEVQGFFQHFMELSSGTFRLQVDHILAEGDLVVVLCTDSAQRGDHSWSSPQVHVWTIRDGYAAIFRQYQGDQQTEDEFWSASV
jgi:ketosteroid isomerase-like protein